MGKRERIFAIVGERDLELEEDFPGLRRVPYKVISPRDPEYNCIAFAVGDLTRFWDDLGFLKGASVNGYYWPPGVPSANTLVGWVKVFELRGYTEIDDPSFDPDFEKIAIYASAEGPQHVSRQKATGTWVSKMGKGVDIEHSSLEYLEGDFYGNITKIMQRKRH